VIVNGGKVDDPEPFPRPGTFVSDEDAELTVAAAAPTVSIHDFAALLREEPNG
jgi:hypothetical protein